MSDLVEFLRARIAEDEQIAGEARGPEWGTDAEPDYASVITDGRQLCDGDPASMQHIARWDPARVLAEVEAKRQILGQHRTLMGPGWCETCDVPGDYQGSATGCPTLKALALAYADHPAYDPAWRP